MEAKGKVRVQFWADGSIADAIKTRMGLEGVPMAHAVVAMLGDAIALTPTAGDLVNLEDVPTDDLIDELVGRLQQIEVAAEAVARAERAEAKLAQIGAALSGGA